MYKLILKISYKGENYHGLVHQNGLKTIYSELYESFRRIKIFESFAENFTKNNEKLSKTNRNSFSKQIKSSELSSDQNSNEELFQSISTSLNNKIERKTNSPKRFLDHSDAEDFKSPFFTLNFFSKLVECAGRTDAGVNARSMYISVIVPIKLPYLKILNHTLPENIKIRSQCYKSLDFSVRFDCVERVYRYFFKCQDEQQFELFKVFGELLKKKLENDWTMEKFCTKSFEKEFKRKNKLKMNEFEVKNCSENLSHDDYSKREMPVINERENFDRNQTIGRECHENHGDSSNFHHNETFSNNLPVSEHNTSIFDKNYYNRPIKTLTFNRKKGKNIFYMEISSKSFLHNQIRRIFYCISQNVLKYNRNDKLQIEYFEGMADPSNLIFFDAKYDQIFDWDSSELEQIDFELVRAIEDEIFLDI